MQYDELTREEYARRTSEMIMNFEGFRSAPYDANDRMATIGYGYTFNRDNNVELWDRAGVQLSGAERQQLAAIDNAPAAAQQSRLFQAGSKKAARRWRGFGHSGNWKAGFPKA